MRKESKAAILEAAAKVIAWELYAASGYGRTRARIDVERFDGELRTAFRRWSAARRKLKVKKRRSAS